VSSSYSNAITFLGRLYFSSVEETKQRLRKEFHTAARELS